MLPRFYAPDLDPAREFPLPADEAHHLTRVLRLAPGAAVAVFDGLGREFRAEIRHAIRDRVILRASEPLATIAAPRVAVTVVQAVLKGRSMDDAVRDATMMGAVAIEPVLTDHVDVKPAVATRPDNLDRWRRVALASVKQSRRATLPVIGHVRPVTEWLASMQGLTLLFVEPSSGHVPSQVRDLLERPVPERVAVMLGPEGGWAVDEIAAAASAGCIPVTLGPLTLRAESMAVAALAALAAIWPPVPA